MIDWVRESSSGPWEVRNITEVDTNGLDLAVTVKPKDFSKSFPLSLVSLGYTYLDSNKELEDNFQSKYVMDYLRQQVSLGLNHSLPFNISQSWKLRYEDRVGREAYFLLDTRLSKNFEGHNIEVFLDGTNLLNTSYTEVGGVTMPGRWMIVGMRIEF